MVGGRALPPGPGGISKALRGVGAEAPDARALFVAAGGPNLA